MLSSIKLDQKNTFTNEDNEPLNLEKIVEEPEDNQSHRTKEGLTTERNNLETEMIFKDSNNELPYGQTQKDLKPPRAFFSRALDPRINEEEKEQDFFYNYRASGGNSEN